jgi:hypothetical protein
MPSLAERDFHGLPANCLEIFVPSILADEPALRGAKMRVAKPFG